jgi:hypothetical protein
MKGIWKWVIWGDAPKVARGTRLQMVHTETDNAIVEAVNDRYVVVRVPGGRYRSGIGQQNYAPACRRVLKIAQWRNDRRGFEAEELIVYDVKPALPGHDEFWK